MEKPMTDDKPRPDRAADSEKITINLGAVDLGRIDLLVQDGFYQNRTDCIRTAIRALLAGHAAEVARSVERQRLDVGLRDLSRAELEAAVAAGTPLRLRVLGLARIAADVSPELARAAIASVTVLGALHAPAAVKAALADRVA
jgi:Arc/MetJ-type ribon-helix-helix transcriptional regulator